MLDLKPSPTLAMNELAARLSAEGRTVYRLGFGQSPFSPPPSVVEALRRHADKRAYPPVQGLPELRDAVADFHRRRHGIPQHITGDDVIVGPGSKELLFLVQLVYRGELLVPSPSWVSYEPQARILGLPVTWLHTKAEDGWRIDPEALDEHLRAKPPAKRVLMLNSPNNPAGTSLRGDRLAKLAEVARRHNLLVISDEIYGELTYAGQPHESIARYYPEGSIVASGLSKWCGAGGWRLGTMCVPREHRELLNQMCIAAGETFSGVNAPVQHAAVSAYRGSAEIETYLEDARQVLRTVSATCLRALQAARIPVVEPEGGFYLFPDFTGLAPETSGRELCRRLLQETGVALLPGADFGRPESELTARLAFVDFDGAEALANPRAVPHRIESALQSLTRAFR